MPYSEKLIIVTSHGSWGPSTDFQIALEKTSDAYWLNGKCIEKDFLSQEKPKTTRLKIKVTAKWAEDLIGKLRAATIPLYPQESDGCDGTFFSMTLGSIFGGATYLWWSVPPSGWEILSEVAFKIIQEFTEHLPVNGE